ncbi:MAG: ABC transporter substrate-binding protein, partial [Bacteroidales bacterium]
TNEKLFTYLSFYEGALLAWQEQQENTSVYFEFKVFDVTENVLSVKAALKDPFLLNANLILSASFVKSFALLSDFSLKHQIPIIHPLSERDQMHLENSYFIQGTPSSKMQIDKWAEYAIAKYPHSNFVVLLDKNQSTNKKAKNFYQNLLNAVHIGKLKADNIALYNIADSGFSKLAQRIKTNRDNVVCAFFEREIAFTNTVIKLHNQNAKIHLLGIDKWLDFDKTEANYLQALNFEYYSPFFAEYKSTPVALFEANYYQMYKTLPNEMAFKGYDYMQSILELLQKYNTNFIFELENSSYQGLGFDFKFVKRENGGYENTCIHKLKLHNFKFIKQQNPIN